MKVKKAVPKDKKSKGKDKSKLSSLPFGAYGVYVNSKREHFKSLCSGRSSEVATLAANSWKELSDAERQPYQQQFHDIKKKHNEEKLRLACDEALKRKDHDNEETAAPESFKRIRPDNAHGLLAVGTEALLQGLQGAATLNGEKCKVISYDQAAGRYLVKMENGSEDKRVRPEHLVACLPVGSMAMVSISAAIWKVLTAQPGEFANQPGELTNQRGHIEGYNITERKYRIRFAEASETSEVEPLQVAPNYIIGQEILLQGLQGASELNGCEAVIEGYDEAKGRYIVRVLKLGKKSDGGMRIRPECVRARLTNGARAVIHGLQQAADFNGKLTEVKGFEEASGRYVLSLRPEAEPEKVANGTETAVQPNRLWIRAKVEVTVWGNLQSTPELMGQPALAEQFDPESWHYLIRSKSGKASYVKHENVCHWLAPGTRVVIQRVPKFNGQLATVESFLALKGIYFVKFDDAVVRQFKPETLCRWYPAKTKVLLRGLPNSVQLDEHVACVQGFDQERGRYLVHLAAGSKVKNKKRASLLRAEHLHTLLPKGSVVKLDNMHSSPELNGKFGKVKKDFDETCGRYIVQLFGDSEPQRFPAEVLCPAVPGEYNEEDAGEEEAAAGDESEEDTSSIDSGDILDRMPDQGSPACSSSSDSSDSLGFRKKRPKPNEATETPKSAIPRGMLRRMVEKTMKGIRTAEGPATGKKTAEVSTSSA